MHRFTVYLVPTGTKSFKKLPDAVKTHLKQELQTLEVNPMQAGEKLKGKYSQFYSFHAKFKGVEYRVIYRAYPVQKEVIIVYAASRENLYRDLERLRL
jgi:mRNA-degrading endonuclease RelE of RelBE toxin-antitoxin system